MDNQQFGYMLKAQDFHATNQGLRSSY